MKINKEKMKFIGEGAEKKVYVNPNNPDSVIGVFHESMEESSEFVKARFYLTKILHLLFPENIPEIHAAASDPYVIVTDKVEDSTRSFTLAERSGKAFGDLKAKLDLVGVAFDDFAGNLKFDKNGDLFYVDSFEPWLVGKNFISKPQFNKEKMEAAIQNLDDDKKELALSYFKRLDEMYNKALSDRLGKRAK